MELLVVMQLHQIRLKGVFFFVLFFHGMYANICNNDLLTKRSLEYSVGAECEM